VAGLLTISVAMLAGNAAGFGILQITTPTTDQWGMMILFGIILNLSGPWCSVGIFLPMYRH